MSDPLYLTVEHIARVCHEANRAYCMSIGDHSQPTWDMAAPWQRESAIEGVRAIVTNPDRQPVDSHELWMVLKQSQGWKYGPKKVPEKKEHPCLVPYAELPEAQKLKDDLFLAIAKTLREHTFDVKGKRPSANVPVPEGEARMVHDRPKDSTTKMGVLAENGDVKKDVTIETKTKSCPRKFKKGHPDK